MKPALVDRVPYAEPTTTASPDTEAPDPLAAIDSVLDVWSARRRAFRRQRDEAEHERREFIRHAEELADRVIRPRFQVIAQRLKACGGDGWLVEHPRDAFHGLRLTLWMALDREVVLLARPDRFPYIQLDLDVPKRRFTVWEGDMWDDRAPVEPPTRGS